MIYICPLCNQLERLENKCPNCQFMMEDKGRVTDYFDDYSAYVDIDSIKMVDGYPTDQQDHHCPHMFYCNQCKNEMIYLIPERGF